MKLFDPIRYTGGAGGWCPGHEPLMAWERNMAAEVERVGGWQSAGGYIYLPDGRHFTDWDDLADTLIRHPSL